MLIDHPIKKLSDLFQKKEISSVDLVKESYSRIEEFDLKLHSFITIKDKTIALKEAEEKDKNINPLNLFFHLNKVNFLNLA